MVRKIALLLGALAMFINAADKDLNVYGSARFDSWLNMTQKKIGDKDTTETSFNWSSSYARGGMKASVDNVKGQFEWQFDGDGKLGIRHLWGQWNITEDVYLKIGQGWTIFMYFPLGSYSDLGFFGGLYAGRKGSFELGIADFKLGIVDPKGSAALDLVGSGSINTTRTNNIPKVEAAYSFSNDMLRIGVGAGFLMYDVDYTVTSGSLTKTGEESITAYGLQLDFGLTLDKFYTTIAGMYAQNYGGYGFVAHDPSGTGFANASFVKDPGDTTAIKLSSLNNNTAFGGVVALGYNITDNVAPEVGFGYNVHNRKTAYEAEKNEKDPAMGFYALCALTMADGHLSFYPEFYYINNMKDRDDNDECKEIAIGMYTVFNF